MTRARRISLGEHHLDDFDPITRMASPAEKTGTPVARPDRMCRRCEALGDPDTAYGLIVAPSGLGHYWPEQGRTLCGADTASWTT